MGWDNRSAYILVRSRKGKSTDVFNEFKDKNYAVGVFQIAGKYDVLIWATTKTVEDMSWIVSEVRFYSEVEEVNVQLACYCTSNERVALLKPGYMWLAIRKEEYYVVCSILNRFRNLAMAVSTSGGYNCIAMLHGDQQDQIHNLVCALEEEACEVECFPALSYYWNRVPARRRIERTEEREQAQY